MAGETTSQRGIGFWFWVLADSALGAYLLVVLAKILIWPVTSSVGPAAKTEAAPFGLSHLAYLDLGLLGRPVFSITIPAIVWLVVALPIVIRLRGWSWGPLTLGFSLALYDGVNGLMDWNGSHWTKIYLVGITFVYLVLLLAPKIMGRVQYNLHSPWLLRFICFFAIFDGVIFPPIYQTDPNEFLIYLTLEPFFLTFALFTASKLLPLVAPPNPMPLSLKISSLVSDTEAFLLGGKPDKIIHSRYGIFSCIDRYTPLQLMPWWERNVKAEVAKCHGLFVDVGANAGLYTVIAGKNGCQVISIEPSLKALKHLNENVRLNDLPRNVTTWDVAAWNKHETLYLDEKSDSGLSSISSSGVEVTGHPLDYILRGRVPELIKIDTEQTEPQVLEGMIETLKLHKTKVIFEAWDSKKYNECVKILESVGYKVSSQLARIVWMATPN